ncbi:MAG: glutathione S-transferase N-terminal domain-containing protein [Candidatus Paceibacterota bacterium]
MLTLYVKTGCPFCLAVHAKVEDLGINVEEKNISDDVVAEELVARGGKRQVPYLVDSERNIEMYESGDINIYLDTYYKKDGKETASEEDRDSKPPQVCTLES